jgi:hypothetical protein
VLSLRQILYRRAIRDDFSAQAAWCGISQNKPCCTLPKYEYSVKMVLSQHYTETPVGFRRWTVPNRALVLSGHIHG